MPRNKDIIEAQAAPAAPAPAAPAPVPAAPAPAAPKAPAKVEPKVAPKAKVPAKAVQAKPLMPVRPAKPAAAPVEAAKPSDEATRSRLETWRIGKSAAERAGATPQPSVSQPVSARAGGPETVLSLAGPGGTIGAGITQIPAGALVPNTQRALASEKSSPGVVTYAQREPGGPWSAESAYFQHPEGMTPAEYARRKAAIQELELSPTAPRTPEEAARLSELATGMVEPMLRLPGARDRVRAEVAASEENAPVGLYGGAAGTMAGAAGAMSGMKAAWPKEGVWPKEGLIRPSYRGVPSVLRSSGPAGVRAQLLKTGGQLLETGGVGGVKGAGWAGVAATAAGLIADSMNLSPYEIAVPEEAMPPRPVRPDAFTSKRVPPTNAQARSLASQVVGGEAGAWSVPRQVPGDTYVGPREFERVARDYEGRYRDQLRKVQQMRAEYGPINETKPAIAGMGARWAGTNLTPVVPDEKMRALERELANLASIRTVLMGELGYTVEDLNRLTP